MKYPAFFPSMLVLSGAVIIFSVAGCRKEQQNAAVPSPSAGHDVVAKTTVLATILEEEKPGKVDPSPENRQRPMVVFNDWGKGVAYSLRKSDGLHIVHNGKTGNPVSAIDAVVLSPDGQRIAYSVPVDDKWRMVVDYREGVRSDEVGEPVFSPDSRHIAYKARMGEQWRMVVDNTTSAGCKGVEGEPVFSADSQKIAYVEQLDDKGAQRLVISDLALKPLHVEEAAGALLLANSDKTRLAAIKQHGRRQAVIQIRFDRPVAVTEGQPYDVISNLVFGSDGVSLSYVAERGGKRFLVLNDREAPLPDGNLPASPVVRPDGKGAGIIVAANNRYFLHQAFLGEGAKENEYDEAAELVYGRDGSLHAYAARRDDKWFVVVNGKEGPVFDRVVTPSFSPDGMHLVYRARKNAQRFVVVADMNGTVVRQHPGYEMVFPTTFAPGGKSVAYGVKDGNKLVWKVERL